MGKAWCAGRFCPGLPQPDCGYRRFSKSPADICFRLVGEWFIYIPLPKILESQTKQKEVKCIFFFCGFSVPVGTVLRLTADLAHEFAELSATLFVVFEHVVACTGGAE